MTALTSAAVSISNPTRITSPAVVAPVNGTETAVPDMAATAACTNDVEVIVIVNDADPVPDAFVAVIVTAALPAAVGVPLICPVAVFTASPAGKPVAPKLVGLFDAAIW